MNQEFETQLQVVQRALGEVVMPALGAAEKHVVEQLHLSIAALAFMQQRLPHARRYYRGTTLSYLAMADAIIQLLKDCQEADSGKLGALVIQGRALLESPTGDIIDYRHFTEELRVVIAGLAASAQGSPQETALDSLIIDHSGPILLQERVWCAPLGFELRPQDLPQADWLR